MSTNYRIAVCYSEEKIKESLNKCEEFLRQIGHIRIATWITFLFLLEESVQFVNFGRVYYGLKAGVIFSKAFGLCAALDDFYNVIVPLVLFDTIKEVDNKLPVLIHCFQNLKEIPL